MKENRDFIAAYCKIKGIYEKTNTTPGTLEKIGFCNKWNSVFATGGQAGIAFNFTGEHAVYGPITDFEPFTSLQRYIGKNLFEFTEHLLPLSGIQMRSICLAALNALSQPVNSPEQNGPSGVFFHSAEENKEILPKSDIVIMSGCTLINGTFKELIEYSQKARIIGMFGPSGQTIPDFLLNCGINYILSNRITQPNGLYFRIMDAFYLGNAFKECTEPYAVTTASFPD